MYQQQIHGSAYWENMMTNSITMIMMYENNKGNISGNNIIRSYSTARA